MTKERTKRLCWIATCVVIPLDMWLAFGFTFTGPQNISFWHWAFVWFTFLLNIPAVLLSWKQPKVSAYWLLGNTSVSILIACGFLWHSYLEGRGTGGSLSVALASVAGRALIMAIFLWAPQIVFAIAFLTAQQRDPADAQG